MHSPEHALQQLHLDQRLQEARQNFDRINNKFLLFVKENPGTCLLGAIAVGFFIGRIAARS